MVKTVPQPQEGTDGQQVPTRAPEAEQGNSRGERDKREGKLCTQERYGISVFES